MSKGMWTKQFSATGKVFYYNSSQNLSVWHPPQDSVVHEAPFAKSPLEETTQLIPNQTEDSRLYILQSQLYNYQNQNIYLNPVKPVPDQKNTASNNLPPLMDDKGIQDKINQAVHKNQKDFSANRFKRNIENDEGGLSGVSEQQSAYLVQKSEYVKMAGAKGGEGSNWLVR